MKKLACVVLAVSLWLVFSNSTVEAAVSTSPDVITSTIGAAGSDVQDHEDRIGGRCPQNQHWCGSSAEGTCCGAHAVCCKKRGGNFHCGYGIHPCR